MGVAERKEGRETKTKGRLGAVGGGIERFEAAKAGGRGNERLNEDEHGFFVADEKRAIEIVFPTFSSSGERGNMDTLADGSLAKPRLRPGEAGNGHERPYFSLVGCGPPLRVACSEATDAHDASKLPLTLHCSE